MSNTVSSDIIVPYRTPLECHNEAMAFLKKHGFYKDHATPATPFINVENLANRAGYYVQPIPGLRNQRGVKATLARVGNRTEIHVDLNHYDNHKNASFSIAEELGHILLHCALFEGASDVEEVIRTIVSQPQYIRKRIEIQAKLVGSCLLLPDYKLRSFAVNFCTDKRHAIKQEGIATSARLSGYLGECFVNDHGLSHDIFNRALTRETPTPIIDELSAILGIGALPPMALSQKIDTAKGF